MEWKEGHAFPEVMRHELKKGEEDYAYSWGKRLRGGECIEPQCWKEGREMKARKHAGWPRERGEGEKRGLWVWVCMCMCMLRTGHSYRAEKKSKWRTVSMVELWPVEIRQFQQEATNVICTASHFLLIIRKQRWFVRTGASHANRPRTETPCLNLM